MEADFLEEMESRVEAVLTSVESRLEANLKIMQSRVEATLMEVERWLGASLEVMEGWIRVWATRLRLLSRPQQQPTVQALWGEPKRAVLQSRFQSQNQPQCGSLSVSHGEGRVW